MSSNILLTDDRGIVQKTMTKIRNLVKPVVNTEPQGLPLVGAILWIRADLKFIVKSHLRRNRIIIQRIPEPKNGNGKGKT